jgi:hypothetical protein
MQGTKKKTMRWWSGSKTSKIKVARILRRAKSDMECVSDQLRKCVHIASDIFITLAVLDIILKHMPAFFRAINAT